MYLPIQQTIIYQYEVYCCVLKCIRSLNQIVTVKIHFIYIFDEDDGHQYKSM